MPAVTPENEPPPAVTVPPGRAWCRTVPLSATLIAVSALDVKASVADEARVGPLADGAAKVTPTAQVSLWFSVAPVQASDVDRVVAGVACRRARRP